MSFFTGTIYSFSLNMDTAVGVILPQDSRKHRGIEELHAGITPRETSKTLILLHGLSDNYSVWLNRTSILRYAEDYDIAVLMPEVQRSFYQDMKYGPAYFTYITEELPQLAAELFHISITPQDLMIAGLSMGGYGALYAALTYPERFYGVGCFSSAFDLRSFVEDDEIATRKELQGWNNDRKGIFGEPPVCPQSRDLFDLALKNAKKSKTPRLFMTCGTEDFLYQSNIAMRDLLSANSYDLCYEEWSGIHEWGFWDLSIQKMLSFFLP
ncbi:MAG: esterase family protein [Treponema sp.]|jgi:S-formylglutathione hydrolase FrmB|nr:esterase family protein [Treponema sp.]